jgi:hypothetical protein
MIRFRCRCGRQLQAADDYAGREAVCPACGHRQTVPDLDAVQTPEALEEVREDDFREAPERRRRPALRDVDEEAERFPAPPTSGKATASLILGVLAVLFNFVTGVPALILGILALRDIDRSRGRLGGRGLAIAGISTGVGLSLICGILEVGGVLAVQKVREAAGRIQSQNNLKQIGIAMHNYHAVNNHFPPAAVPGPAGGGNLSWRVHLLPYLDEEALYGQFHPDEPWDSPHNKALLPRMPKVYTVPGDESTAGLTHYQVFTGPRTLFERMPDRGPREGVRLPDVTDGTSNTAMAAVAATAVPWTKPDDLAFDPAGPLPRLDSRSGYFLILMADGSVRMVKPDTPEATLRAVITRNGGEAVALP